MGEKNPKGLSVSFRVDSGFLDHNNRVITVHNVDISRTSDNVTYTKINLRDFEQRNPNLKVFNAVMHLDESTPHLRIDLVPVAHKEQRGMPLKNSMSGALREQGFSSSNRMENERTAWAESERSVMEQILLKHGLRREDKNIRCPHLSVEDYKKAALEARNINEINAHITALKKKSETNLTPKDAALLNNQNDFLRSTITELNRQIEDMSKKAGYLLPSLEI